MGKSARVRRRRSELAMYVWELAKNIGSIMLDLYLEETACKGLCSCSMAHKNNARLLKDLYHDHQCVIHAKDKRLVFDEQWLQLAREYFGENHDTQSTVRHET